jgi:ribonucleoside-diphosphate reductase alpha chain
MGFTEKVKIGCGNLYITVNYDEQGVCEVFTNTGRAGGCPSQSEATARLVSIACGAE